MPIGIFYLISQSDSRLSTFNFILLTLNFLLILFPELASFLVALFPEYRDLGFKVGVRAVAEKRMHDWNKQIIFLLPVFLDHYIDLCSCNPLLHTGERPDVE